MKLIYSFRYNCNRGSHITNFKGKKVVIEPYEVILWAATISVLYVNYPPINWQACNSASVDQLKY